MEQNRNIILNEYLSLTKKLNSSNRKKNEKTEVIFSLKIDSVGTSRLVVSTNNEKYLSLAYKNNQAWYPEQDQTYPHLIQYLILILRLNTVSSTNCHLTIRGALHKLFSIQEVN